MEKKTANGSIPGPITVRYLADLELSESVDVTQKYSYSLRTLAEN